MQQRWWLLAVAVVGVGLAVLLVPRPDTGDIPDPPPDVEPVVAPTPRPVRTDLVPGPPPGAEEVLAHRNRPAGKASRSIAAPLGAVRYALNKDGSDEAKDLATRIGEVQGKLVNMRSSTDNDLDGLIAEFDPLLAELKADYADNSDISAGVKRYEEEVEAWNQSAKE